MWNLKKKQQTSEYNKTEPDSQRTNLWLPVGNGGEEGQHRVGEWEVNHWVWDRLKDVSDSAGAHGQYSIITIMGGTFKTCIKSRWLVCGPQFAES